VSGWNPVRYQDRHSFVWRYGANLLELLEPRPDERILDLGCGTGQLTAEIARSGAQTIGLDSSEEMIAQARNNFPELTFIVADAEAFDFPEPLDAVFSNAALHWVKNAEGAVSSIARALRPGGRFVAELGGKGNIASVQAALRTVIGPGADQPSPWYFPSIGEYAPLLERHGLELRYASLFDRPTPLEGANGMEHWLQMFAQTYFRQFSQQRSRDILQQLIEHLRPVLCRDGVWTVDYRRLRLVAFRNKAGTD